MCRVCTRLAAASLLLLLLGCAAASPRPGAGAERAPASGVLGAATAKAWRPAAGVPGGGLSAHTATKLPVAERTGAPWPWWPGDDPRVHSAWARTLEALWDYSKDSVGFCFGRREDRVVRLVGLSFPWPLPSGPPEDALCSNSSRVDAMLCGPAEVEHYYKFELLTEDPEKVPDSSHCSASSPSDACSPGWFDAELHNRLAPSSHPQQPHACCPGMFCPSSLSCMIPCPLGSVCPRAQPALPPSDYRRHGGEEDQWCAPYAYKQRKGLGCGGADKWRIVPTSAFPTQWWPAGSGSIYCDGGHFCPNTTAMLECTAGHFCKQGSTAQERCPPGAHCPPGTEVFEQNYTGVTVDALLFLLLGLAWQLSLYWARVLRRLGLKERLRITWGAHPEFAVVPASPRATCAEPYDPRQQQALSASGSEGELAPGGGPEEVESGADEQQQQQLGAEVGAAAPAGDSPRPAGSVWRLGQLAQAGSGALGYMRSRTLGLFIRRSSSPVPGSGYEPLPEPEGADGAALPSPQVPLLAVERELAPPSPLQRQGVGSHTASPAVRPSLSAHGTPQAGGQPASLAALSLQQPASRALAGGAGRKTLLTVEFENLGLRLKSCGRMVLAGVSGKLRGARITAIMGPSGAGKTSLLNTLAGKAPYGVITGQVSVNGRRDRLERYRSVTGFVPQEDIMHATLSVEETLTFAARYRLPAHYTRRQHLLQVERAIRVLQLEDVRHELIGNEETRGISGGQRKRVNVGIELVADPSLIFLDEPTSGLDSAASKALLAALQAVVRTGVTAAAVLHQPSYEMFSTIDDVLLLGKGGRTVYYGPVAEVQAYFEGLGYEIPPRMNPADCYLDIIAGSILRDGQQQAAPVELFDAWEERCGRGKEGHAASGFSGALLGLAAEASEDGQPLLLAQPNTELLGDTVERRSWRRRARELLLFSTAYLLASVQDAWEGALRGLAAADRALTGGRLLRRPKPDFGPDFYSADGLEEEGAGDAERAALARRRRSPGFLPQFYWCISRAVIMRLREPLLVFADYVIIAATGMTLGLISDRGRGTIMHYAASIAYSVVALGLMATVGALTTFGRGRVVFDREAASGLNRLAHFLALEAFDHLGTLLRSAVYLVMWYSFAAPRAVIWQLYLVTVAIMYCCSGTAYLLSQVMEPSSAQLAAAVLALVNTLIARQSDPGALARLAQQLSFARWGLEGYVISESNRLTGVWLLARCADLEGLGYDVRRFGLCLAALFALGALFRCAALLCLLVFTGGRQR